ncbi:hypothetical protein HGO38_30415 [Rhizobium sp. CG5]|uniref:hypothetical protein n=1 Tax=Rhizobium sp. CG5 TaxID=2726076 RepID=UPI0020336659|nr:hypothetical protein [Rhizobium sp. CG5]MCM2477763.1 hypothetical protein [Rhizobium sp. CG5]
MSAVSLVESSVAKAPDQSEGLLGMLRLMAAHEGEFGPASALLKYGRAFPHVNARPKALRMGPKGLCYCNCTRARYPYLADDPVPYHYAEGYALDPDLGVPLQHAWLVDLNGRAIDLTWTDTKNVIYFGVTFNDAFVYQAMKETGLFGILPSVALQKRLFANSAAFKATLWKPTLPGLPSGRLCQT